MRYEILYSPDPGAPQGLGRAHDAWYSVGVFTTTRAEVVRAAARLVGAVPTAGPAVGHRVERVYVFATRRGSSSIGHLVWEAHAPASAGDLHPA